ncbi:MAG: heparan-alpha-glucosaminide N-acetyltransferase domain-containing protein, partial [Anaerolineales bacterium]
MTTKTNRDYGLDVLKGIGCALMVIAHSKLKMWDYEGYLVWGQLAPALFFSAAGVTAVFQIKKPLREMLVLYGLIFLFGFSYSGFLNPDFLSKLEFEIIQTIALSVLIIYTVEKYLRPNSWLYLALGCAALGLDKLIYPLGFEKIEGIFIAPGLFPLFPWLSMFFFGVFAYRVKNSYNFILFFIIVLAYYSLFGFVTPDINAGKWQFLLDFFLFLSAFLFISFFLIRAVYFLQNPKFNWLTIFWGTNSLLFLYIHYAFIKFFRLFEI